MESIGVFDRMKAALALVGHKVCSYEFELYVNVDLSNSRGGEFGSDKIVVGSVNIFKEEFQAVWHKFKCDCVQVATGSGSQPGSCSITIKLKMLNVPGVLNPAIPPGIRPINLRMYTGDSSRTADHALVQRIYKQMNPPPDDSLWPGDAALVDADNNIVRDANGNPRRRDICLGFTDLGSDRGYLLLPGLGQSTEHGGTVDNLLRSSPGLRRLLVDSLVAVVLNELISESGGPDRGR